MSIYDQVLSFIASPDPHSFDALALEVFQHQLRNVAPYRAYCASLGIDPHRVTALDAIPPVSTLAFKFARLAPEHAGSDALTFHTSGTTIGKSDRGMHIVARPDIYRASAIAHLLGMMFPDRLAMRMLALHPTADRLPESSLSQMISWCIEEFGGDRYECAATRDGIDPEAAAKFLRNATGDQQPVCILATTAALGALFTHLKTHGERLELPARSRIMDTGGAKGQAHALDAAQVCDLARELLGVAPPFVINEYGMTELCSQLYDATSFNSDSDAPMSDRVKIAPPWMKAAAVDPLTLRTIAPGEPGMLRFFDLANASSVSAILTEDVGIVDGDRVKILGRAGFAEPRGCALAIAEFESVEAART